MKKLLLFITCSLLVSTSFGQRVDATTDNTAEARARVAKGDLDGAVQFYTKCIERDPVKFHCYGERGEVYLLQYKLDPAVADLTKAIELAPDVTAEKLKPSAPKPKYLTKRGDVYQLKRSLELAKADYERALAIDGEFYEALVGLGIVTFSDDRNKAAGLFNTAIRLRPDRPEAFREVGILFTVIGTEQTYKQAYDYFSKAIAADPTYATAYMDRFQIPNVFGTEQSKFAANNLADISKFIELRPDNSEAYFFRGVLYLADLEKPVEAIADLTKAIGMYPDARYYASRADAYIAVKDHKKVVDDLTKVLELSRSPQPLDLRGWLRKRAESYIALGNTALAVKDYDQILSKGRDLALQEKRNILASGDRKPTIQLTGDEKADHEKLIAEMDAGRPIGEQNLAWLQKYRFANNIK
jgi:tetratricopeptide (TPR) repeat protein